jgi:anti-anti-sigma factor
VAPRHSITLQLVQAPGPLAGRAFTFDQDGAASLSIGRADDADVRLDIPSVSRQHAVLSRQRDNRWQISDAGSRNGIAVNGTRLPSAVLGEGDRVAFGPDVVATFRSSAPPAGAAPLATVVTPAQDIADGTLRVTTRRSSIDGGIVVVEIAGRIDGYNYSDFRDRVQQVIDGGDHLLLLDFAACSFCDHVGLSVVVSAKASLDKRRGRVCLTGVDERLRQGLKLLRLDTLLAIEADEAASVRRLLR